MSGPLRRPTIPHCSACVRNYAFGTFDVAAPTPTVRSQVRGKKKMVNNSATVPVRLLKDMPTFGKKGHLLPIPRGQMRNKWFPQRIASYITAPELRTLRLSGTPTERDFTFGEESPLKADPALTKRATAPWEKDITGMSTSEIQAASAFQKAPVLEKLSPERSMELVEIFVPKRLDFYRQPIIEEKGSKEEEAVDEGKQKKPKFTMGGAAGDLLAARQKEKGVGRKREDRQTIYGSVSAQDVLVAMRAAMGNNDEAARVVLHEEEIRFVDLPATEEPDRVKHVGEFSVDVMVRGAEEGVRRTVRVIAQEM